MKKSITQINETYDLQLERIIKEIKKKKAKIVLLQFPDGLKPYATSIVDYLEEQTSNKTEFLIWLGSCFGACDTPTGIEKIKPKVDLIIQFGHNKVFPSY